MLYKKQGFPEEGDIVLCTVKKILFHSIFASLDEYKNLEGMIHISEVSPGRIRNLRDFVKEGKQIVCKILRVDKEKGHIDLSIRRVNTSQRIQKNQEFKQEQKAEKILEIIAKNLDLSLEKIYEEIGFKLIEEFETLYNGLQSIALDPKLIEPFKTNKKIKDALISLVQERIKPQEIEIRATLTLKSIASNGIEVIKDILKKIKNDNTSISYISAPTYRVIVKAPDYKKGEEIIKNIEETFLKLIKAPNISGEFKRDAH